MSNSYFHFKQFTIFQERTAMKVGTDGVLLGAWVDITNSRQILDIGTGTGLIALMLAQRSQGFDQNQQNQSTTSPVRIDAVEIETEATDQARDNVRHSPWAAQIQVHQRAIQDYTNSCTERYDLLVSNPPFFDNAYKAPQAARTLARHSDSLTQIDLLRVAAKLLNANGMLSVIYPTEQAHSFLSQAREFNFFCERKLNVKPTPEQPVKRILLQLYQSQKRTHSQICSQIQEVTLTIEVSKHIYTPEFIALIKDFYLNY